MEANDSKGFYKRKKRQSLQQAKYKNSHGKTAKPKPIQATN